MNAFVRTFGGAATGPLAKLAGALAPLTPDPAATVEHVLRFTGIPWDQAAVLSGTATATSALISSEQYIGWLQRFGTEGDGIAYANARALFTSGHAPDGMHLLPWYHGLTASSAGAAQALLAGKPRGTFLVRISGSVPGSFAASYVIGTGEVRHTRVHRELGGYKCELLEGRTTPLPTLVAAVADLASALATPLPSALSQASRIASCGRSSGETPPPAAIDAYGVVEEEGFAKPAAAALTKRAPAASTLAAPAPEPSFDTMISYQWDDQATAVKIKAALEALGVSVWMDVTNMGAGYAGEGKLASTARTPERCKPPLSPSPPPLLPPPSVPYSTADQMVKAVRRSRCIILCASHKYIRSANCEVEVNLAFEYRKQKALVIVNLDADFYPGRCDHTLAALSAGTLYCDFTGARASAAGFAKGMIDLRRQLTEHGILQPQTAAMGPAGAAAGPPPAAAGAATAEDPSYIAAGFAAAPSTAGSGYEGI